MEIDYRREHVGVTASAIVAILGSMIALLFAAFMAASVTVGFSTILAAAAIYFLMRNRGAFVRANT